jgi:hypothetical protein
MIKDVYIRSAYILSLLLLAISFIFVHNAFKTVDHLLVIHFDSYRGIDFLGNKSDVFGILGMGLAINIINILISNRLYNRDMFLSRLLSFTSAFFSGLILIAVTVIISVN